MMSAFEKLIGSAGPILLDGAMGTMLMDAGLESGDPPEEWNLIHPERIQEVHRQYIQAGSQVILTNSFGGTSYRLAMHHLQDQVTELNRAAAQLARTEADQAPHLVLVAGSMGPTGQLLEPVGELVFADAVEAFAEQASGLAAGGVDLFWIETMSDLGEVRAAAEGIRRVSELPISATLSFDTHKHTMMGVDPLQAVESLEALDLALLGANCGTGSDELIEIIQLMATAEPDLPLVAKANAGVPQVEGGEVVYNGTPEIMADYAVRVYQQRARLIGGCCGSTPDHIRAMADALNQTD
jgi:5-methyltetrahydrofolate--homocysteine methyltransferase